MAALLVVEVLQDMFDYNPREMEEEHCKPLGCCKGNIGEGCYRKAVDDYIQDYYKSWYVSQVPGNTVDLLLGVKEEEFDKNPHSWVPVEQTLLCFGKIGLAPDCIALGALVQGPSES